MKTYTLYVHEFPNHKLYIGITYDTIQHRWRNGGYGYKNQRLMQRAIQKYGWDNIKHIVLFENLSKEVACECEKYLIAKYQTNNPKYGYNVATGGEHNSGFHFHHTDETKQKISESSRGHIISEKQRKQISEAHKGKTLSQESRNKISKSISNIMTDDYRKRISESVKQRWKEGAYVNRKYNRIPWNKGLTKNDPRVAKFVRKVGEFHHTDDAKLKMSKSHMGKPAHNRKKVLCVETGITYESVSSASKQTGINNISKSARMNTIAGGFHWRYIEDDNI